MLQRRQILEREARMRGLRANYNMVLEQSAQSIVSTSGRGILINLTSLEQLEIADHAQRLRQRVEFLSSARNEFALDVETDDSSERFVGIYLNWLIADIMTQNLVSSVARKNSYIEDFPPFNALIDLSN